MTSIATRQRKQRMASLLMQMAGAISESMYDFVVTFFTMLVALIAVYAASNGIAFLISWGMFVIISIYLILLVIRMLRRLDNSWTVNEIGDHIEQLAQSIEEIKRNG